MSTFTTSIHMIYNQVSTPGKTTEERVKETADWLFDFTFPWYSVDTTGREEFKELFVRQYFLNEIAFETVELFKLKLMQTLAREMPKYRQLYESTLKTFDPFETIHVETTGDATGSENYSDSETAKKDDVGTRSHTTITDRDFTVNSTNSDNGSDKEESQSRSEKASTTEGQEKVTDSASGQTNSKTTDEHTSEEHKNSTLNGTENNQSIHSDNPQTDFAGHDYASMMDRGQAIKESEASETTTGQGGGATNTTGNTQSTNDSDKNTSSSGNESGMTAGSIIRTSVRSSEGYEDSDMLEDVHFAENYDLDSTNEVNKTGKKDTETTHQTTEKGFRADRSSLLLKYRETFLNINEMLLNDCGSLFLKIYRSGYEPQIGGGYYGLFV